MLVCDSRGHACQLGRIQAAAFLRLRVASSGCLSLSFLALSLCFLWKESGTAPRKTPFVTCVANCTHSGAHQWPYQHPLMHPHNALPFLSALCFFCSAWAAVVQSHTLGCLLFDFTPVLRWLRQTRPGISAMWLKNGNRRQEYKRRHTGCGSGSLAGEWVVD